jgi:hypothetical protein
MPMGGLRTSLLLGHAAQQPAAVLVRSRGRCDPNGVAALRIGSAKLRLGVA